MPASNGFVWFHNGSEEAKKSTRFYEELVGWKGTASPDGATLLSAGGQPFASVAARGKGPGGWVPYVEVPNLDAATAGAKKLGATVLTPRIAGPMGDFTVVQDPGGAQLALWQKRS